MDDRAVMSHLRDDDNLRSWVCQFCGEPFPYDIHPEVIRHHLTWKCESAPEDVKEATQRIEEDGFSISVEGNNNNFNANSEDSRYAGREVEGAGCSISVNWEQTRIHSISVQESLEVEAEVSSVQCSNKRQIECNTIQSSNKRRRSTPDALPTVAALEVPMVEGIQDGEGRGFPFSDSLSNISLLHLRLISIGDCHYVKKLFPPSLLHNLHNLQMLSVKNCYGMEEIFSTDQEEDEQELSYDHPNLTALHLSRLTKLTLRYLPQLRCIYKGPIICHSLQEIELFECPKLKRIPFPLPQPSLRSIKVYPQKWLQSLNWCVDG